MSSPIKQVAEAVKAALNEASYTESFRAVRSWRWKHDLEALSSVAVTVAPLTEESVPVGRLPNTRDTLIVGVIVQKRVAVDSNGIVVDEDVDKLIDFVEELKDTFRSQSKMAGYTWRGTSHDPIFDDRHLDEFKILTSVFTLTYLGIR